MQNKADLVVSYTVHGGGSMTNYESVTAAIEEGYRIIDVIVTPANASQGFGDVVVTVVMSLHAYAGSGFYKKFLERSSSRSMS